MHHRSHLPMGKCAIPNLDSHWILYEIASYLVKIGLKYQFQSKKFWIIGDKISFQNKTESSSDFNRHQESLSTFQNIIMLQVTCILSSYCFEIFKWTKCSNILCKWTKCSNVHQNEQNVQICSLKWTKCSNATNEQNVHVQIQ